MTTSNEFDRRISAWLDQEATPTAPDDLLSLVVTRAARTSHRQAWATRERWFPMETRARFGAVPRAAIALAVLGLLLVVFTAISLASGSAPSTKVPPPFGIARNGLIAYDSLGDIWVVQPDGSDPRRLTDDLAIQFSPEFSPDGRWLAWWDAPNTDPIASDGSDVHARFSAGMDQGVSLRVAPVDDPGQARTVATDVLLTRAEALPHWSPDSSRLALASRRVSGLSSVPQIQIATVSGDPAVDLLSPGEDPVWSPDGDRLAYKGGSLATVGLYEVPIDDPSASRQLTTIGPSEQAYWEPQWRPESGGSTIAFYGPDFDIWVTDPSADQGARPISDDPANEYFPMWSPAGDRIAYVRVTDSPNLIHAVIVDPDGQNERVLEHPPLYGVQLVWSPDGTRLLGSPPNLLRQTSDEILLLDAVGNAAPMSIPTVGQVGFSSWQRVALP